MFMVLTCLLMAMAIRPHDNGVLDIVVSFHNEVVSAICHHLLLVLPSLMASLKGKYCMIFSIISVGSSMMLADFCPAGL